MKNRFVSTSSEGTHANKNTSSFTFTHAVWMANTEINAALNWWLAGAPTFELRCTNWASSEASARKIADRYAKDGFRTEVRPASRVVIGAGGFTALIESAPAEEEIETGTESEFSRFDYPKEFKIFLDVALETKTFDVLDLVACVATHKGNARAIMEDVIETAFADRHCNPEKHARVCAYADVLAIALNKK